MRLKKYKSYVIVLILALACWAAVIPEHASAHAYVVSSSPSSGEVLEKSPESIFIQFDEEIEPAFYSLQVLSPSGERLDKKDAAIDPSRPDRLVAGLTPGLVDGIYTIKWKVVSSDGHPVSGTLAFQIGNPGAGSVPIVTSDNQVPSPEWSLLLIRWLWYAGMTLTTGTLLFQRFLLPRSARINGIPFKTKRSKLLLNLGIVLAATGIIASLPQQSASNAGVSWTSALSADLISETLQYTGFGTIWKIQLALLALLAFASLLWMRIGNIRHPRETDIRLSVYAAWAAMAFSQGLMLSKAFIGHAAAAEGKALAVTADYLHLSAASLWLGGLLAIVFLLPEAAAKASSPEEVASGQRPLAYWQAVSRFSALASASVAVLLISGIYGTVIHIPSLSALFQTGYGLALLAKIAVFLFMLGLAFTGFLRGRRRSRPLGRGVWVELALGFIVLALAAVLANQPPPSTAAGLPDRLEATVQGHKITLEVTPRTIGKNHFAIKLQDPDGKPMEQVEQVTLSLTSLEMDMGLIEVVMPGGSSELEADGIITMGGDWNVQVHILLKSLESLDHDFTLHVDSN